MNARREFIAGAGALALVLVARDVRATPAAVADAVARITGGVLPRVGRVTLTIPPLVENGNAVPLVVSAASPMTAGDHVRSIHVLAEKNPLPQVFGATFGPRAARAQLETRVRLADTQTVLAFAQWSDGSWWSARAEVLVTSAACVEEL